MNAIIPKIEIMFRVGTLADLPFIDALQKKHSKQLGFFPRAQMEGYLKNEWVLVAEEGQGARGKGQEKTNATSAESLSSLAPCPSPLAPIPLGYIAWRDRYQKRDELGAIFQLCVAEGVQRKLVGAMLLKSAFDRAPYGCKLFCCWCAQDIAANKFWEAMGFIPLAFRSGSRAKDRVHIFWQKRIRSGDDQTPFWFPSLTGGGSIREDRLVLPIPPGVGWKDVMPVILPSEERHEGTTKQIGTSKLDGKQTGKKKDEKTPVLLPPTNRSVQFGKPSMKMPVVASTAPVEASEKPKRVKKEKIKNDPKFITAARELRDRWMEQVNDGAYQIESNSKYDVCRLESPQSPRGGRIEDARSADADHAADSAAHRVIPLLIAA